MGEVIHLSECRKDRPAATVSRARRTHSRSLRAQRSAPVALRLVAPDDAAAPLAAVPAISGSPAGAATGRPVFFFELGCPATYLAAERIERAFGQVRWVPTARLPRSRDRDAQAGAELLARARREADALRLPLVVPERLGADFLPAWRAAAFAAGHGAGGRFALAASRLAFCGGYDIDTRTVLTEAARAAGLSVRECLAAAADSRWDDALFATADELVAAGVDTSPAIRIAGHWFQGLRAVSDAAAFSALSALRDAARAKHS